MRRMIARWKLLVAVIPLLLLQGSAFTKLHAIDFAGHTWLVKESIRLVGPGPNIFSKENVSALPSGLHLRMSRQEDAWTSAEVVMVKSLGYGTYTFKLDSLDVDSGVTFGAFLYDEAAAPWHREIDIELGGVGKSVAGATGTFAVQPTSQSGHTAPFFGDCAAGCTLVIYWMPGIVDFTVATSAGKETWAVRGAMVPKPGEARVRMNLWRVARKEIAVQPQVVISDFTFASYRKGE